MRKFITLILLTMTFAFLNAQNMPYSEFKAGVMNPKDAKAGWIFSYGTGKTIDEAFSWMVDFGLFAKRYSKTTAVDTTIGSQVNETTVQKELEFSTYLLPIMFKITFDKKMSPSAPITLKGSAGLGYQFLWNKEQNYLTKKKDTRFYHGFAYELSFGAGIQMSSSAVLFAEAFYHGGKVKRNQTKTEDGLPVWTEVDMSGPGIRIGVNFVNFGLF